MSNRFPRRLGSRVVRRRLDAQSVINLESDVRREDRPTVTANAKRFVLAVIVIFALGAFFLMLPWSSEDNTWTSPIDALFVAVSAFSVTGLTTVDTQTHWSFFGEFVIVVLMQMGGFGFMVGTSLILIALGRGASLRANVMMRDGSPTMSLQDASRVSFKILKFILVTEAIGAVILTLHFMRTQSFLVAVWWGIFHSVSAFCNAGFDLQGNFKSMSGETASPVVLMTIAGLIQMGALSYMVFADVWGRKSWKPLRLDTKLIVITNFVLISIAGGLYLIVEWNHGMQYIPNGWKPMNALFQAIAARTAGFSSADWSMAHNSTVFLWIAVMMVGGAAGSTAGGAKLATIAVLILAVASTVRGQSEPQAFGRRIVPQVVFRALSIVALFLIMHFVLSLLLVLTEDVFNPERFSFLSLMFESMSALATVGLSTGITPALSVGGKAVLILGMFIGRLGPITLAYALQNRQKQERYRYAEANIRIG